MPRIEKADAFVGSFKNVVLTALEMIGKNMNECEQCGVEVSGRNRHIHHTKYEGATLYDLQIVCHKCNTSKRNWYLV